MAVLELTVDSFDAEILRSDLPAMVDFWAPWCGPCRVMAPIVESIAERYQGKVKVAKVNVDENTELAIRYSIMSIPTLLFFRDGQVIDKIIGLVPEREIEERLNKLLGE
ncbi:MAG: thioredoxin [Armatimonadota bacterium]|nr:thioredoxin [Armatimonadota bacterium]MCX7778385.1 thioredoxin [Armatimonadota bacterium]MDW8026541.1 thioredoxin [Armatimonadota bacterium]